MIHGTGVDIVDIGRFRTACERWGGAIKRKLFTELELSYCESRKDPELHLAARFAAKEALYKAMGDSARTGAFRFIDVEVLKAPDGRPFIKAKTMKAGFTAHLSISHDGGYSVAQVILEKT